MRQWKSKKISTQLKVGIVVATYRQRQLLTLLRSLCDQTYQYFQVVVAHDGPFDDKELARTVLALGEHAPKFQFVSTSVRENVFGHNCRRYGLRFLFPNSKDVPRGHRLPDCVMFTNGDNYYAPTFLEAMVFALQNADLAYCNCVHSHQRAGYCWQPMDTKLERGKIDVGCWVTRSDFVTLAEWGKGFAADWDYLQQVLSRDPRVCKVKEFLFVHN